jgi:NO-binding membrane sensor protein with MHYT domain
MLLERSDPTADPTTFSRGALSVAEVHHFTYGAFNPIAAYLLAFLGSFLGLLSTGRARQARTRGRRNRWLIIAAFAIGGGAIWLMNFTAMLGFDVPASPVRYNPRLTVISLGLAVLTVGIGVLVVGHGRPGRTRVVAAGIVTGLGVLAMHYTGTQALNVAGSIHYRPLLVIASGLIAILATTASLWFTVSVRGWGPTAGAAAVMALAVCGMHYTGMAAIQVRLNPVPHYDVSGMPPLLMIVPITLITAAVIVGVALSALQAMTEEEFTNGAVIPRRGVHAEHSSLKQAIRRAPRPTPRPVRPRPHVPPAPVDELLEPVTGS